MLGLCEHYQLKLDPPVTESYAKSWVFQAHKPSSYSEICFFPLGIKSIVELKFVCNLYVRGLHCSNFMYIFFCIQLLASLFNEDASQ